MIPNSWRSVTLGSILYKLTDGTHKAPKYAINGVKFVSVKDMSSGKLDFNDTKFITQKSMMNYIIGVILKRETCFYLKLGQQEFRPLLTHQGRRCSIP